MNLNFDRTAYEKKLYAQPKATHIVDQHWTYNTGWNRTCAVPIEDRPNDGTWDGEGLTMPCGHTIKRSTVTRSNKWYDVCTEGHTYKRV